MVSAVLRSVAGKALWERRRALAAWTVGIVALIGMYAGFYPSISGSTAYTDLINQMPSSLRDLFTAGMPSDFTSGTGYLYLELMSFMAPLLVIAYAIGAGATAVAGEEERHTLDLLLATPLSRRRLVVEQFAAMVGGLAVLTLGMGIALVGFGAAAGMHLSTANVAAAMAHLLMLGVVFGGLALAVGAGTGRLSFARAVPSLLALVAYVVNGFAPSVSWLEAAQKVSPFYQYIGHDPLRNGLSGTSLVVSITTTLVTLTAAVWLLGRRDTA
jgi:ABC-2 type transport system permease protein